MALKSKIVGTIAAFGLSFSMLAGVAAAPASGSVGGTVELKEGLCGISLSQSSGDFGDFTYVENGYTRTGGNPEIVVSGTVFASKPGGKCDVTLYTEGLTGPSGYIPTNHFSWSLNGSGYMPAGTVGLPASYTFEDVGAGNNSIGFQLDSVPSNFQPGDYDGTLEVTVSNAS